MRIRIQATKLLRIRGSAFHSHISRLPLPRIIRICTVFGDTNIVKAREHFFHSNQREREKKYNTYLLSLERKLNKYECKYIWTAHKYSQQNISYLFTYSLFFKTRSYRSFPASKSYYSWSCNERAIRPACESYLSCMWELFVLHARDISSCIWELFPAAYESYFQLHMRDISSCIRELFLAA